MDIDWGVGLFLLVFVSGALVGYTTSLYQLRHRGTTSVSGQTKHRLQLLFDSNLLDSYSNDAIDHFIQTLEVRPKTLPVHIAVGRHYRQQGEVDKAILIHQNLIAHPELSDEDAEPIVFELVKDYRKAGLLDRAEVLLLELAKSSNHARASEVLLMEIYEQEKDWNKAIATALNVRGGVDDGLRLRLAHYYCELADVAVEAVSQHDITQLYGKALASSVDCVRAELALAQIYLDECDVKAAFALARQIAEKSAYCELAVPVFERCLEDPLLRDDIQTYLEALYLNKQQLPILFLLLNQYDKGANFTGLIEQRLLGFLAQHPDAQGLQFYLLNTLSGQRALLEPLRQPLLDYLDRQCREQKSYQCQSCGFSGSKNYWQCPGCHQWQTIRTVSGL